MSKKIKYEFLNKRGEKLAGSLEMPDKPTRAYVLFAHCFTCTKDIAAAARISRGLARQGFAVMRFDFSGLGNSEGDFANTSFSTNVEDLILAANQLAITHQAPSLIIGHSLGGSAVLVAAGHIPSIQAVVTIAAPSDPAHINRHYEQEISKINQEGQAEVRLGGKPFIITKAFLADVSEQKLLAEVAKLKKPLLIFHSPVDEVVDIKHAKLIYQAAKHPKSFISLEAADHLIRGKENSQYVADTIAAWASRYIKPSNTIDESEAIPPKLAHGEIMVQELGVKYTQRISSATHKIESDEPANLGGADKGFTPYDLLLAAVGSCTSITLRMYLDHKKLDLGLLSVKLTGHKEGEVYFIRREIHIAGKVDDKVKERILHIANRCPVHKTVHGKVKDEVLIVD